MSEVTERRRPKALERRRPKADLKPVPYTVMTEEAVIDQLDQDLIKAGLGKLSTKQQQANVLLGSAARHICLVGGSRSGKTTALVRAVVIRALKVKSRHAILRFRSNAVWPSIGMDTFPKVMATFFPGIRYIANKSLHYFEFENGSQVWLGGLDDKERTEKILGNEYSTIYLNECSQIPYSSVMIALSRLAENVTGLRQKAYYDLNPSSTAHWTNIQFGDKKDPISRRPLTNPEAYCRLFMNPHDNAENLDKDYLLSLDDMPERYRKRFRDGDYVDESDDALWKLTTLARCRRYSDEVPRLTRIVVAVDPSGAKNQFDVTHDEIGIMVVGIGEDGHGYVLADRTMLGGPHDWARAAVFAYHTYKADSIVAEINYGGAMVESTIRTADPAVPIKVVTASRGKTPRAEPVAALYEQGKVHHVERRDPTAMLGMDPEGFAKLEDEQCAFTTHGYIGERSPNRADALVWAVSELMVEPSATGFLEYYRQQADIAHGRTPTPSANTPIPRSFAEAMHAGTPLGMIPTPQEPDEIVLRTEPNANFYVPSSTGRPVRVASDRMGLLRTKDEVVAQTLMQQGCRRVVAETV
jgi:phage terminase large subunit-like protein